MSRAVTAIAVATVGGLLLGAAIPQAEQVRPLALPMLFIQTTVAVGALSEVRSTSTRRWAWRMFLRHHLIASIPLMALGLLMGLDTSWGVGTFVLGAAPTAIALPSNVAACGGQVRPAVQFTLLGYGAGVVITPALVLLALGASGRADLMVTTLLVGLVVPAMVGVVARPWLQRIPRGLGFAIVAASVLVLMLGMGSDLRDAVALGREQRALLWLAGAIGFGRVAWGASLALRFPPQGKLRLEAVLAGGGKNAVLAAVIANASFGPLAALPALVSLFAEITLLFTVSALRNRLHASTPP